MLLPVLNRKHRLIVLQLQLNKGGDGVKTHLYFFQLMTEGCIQYFEPLQAAVDCLMTGPSKTISTQSLIFTWYIWRHEVHDIVLVISISTIRVDDFTRLQMIPKDVAKDYFIRPRSSSVWPVHPTDLPCLNACPNFPSHRRSI